MVRPLRISYPHAFYHVTCRGNERKEIYKDDQDRTLFLEKLPLRWSEVEGQALLILYSPFLSAYLNQKQIIKA